MNFTVKELKEIEKRFDLLAERLAEAQIRYVREFGTFPSSFFMHNVYAENTECFKIFREISKKCEAMIDERIK